MRSIAKENNKCLNYMSMYEKIGVFHE